MTAVLITGANAKDLLVPDFENLPLFLCFFYLIVNEICFKTWLDNPFYDGCLNVSLLLTYYSVNNNKIDRLVHNENN